MHNDSLLEQFHDFVKISTVDAHTGGEPLRILVDGLPEIPGISIIEKQQYFREHLDHIRTAIIGEPRGHSDMYGAVLVEPGRKQADVGVFFLHNAGYSTMCGHAIIALTKILIELDLIQLKQEHVVFDTPAGIVKAQPIWSEDGKRVNQVEFENVASFVVASDLTIQVETLGTVNFDLVFGGAFYALIPCDQLNVSLHSIPANHIIRLGRLLKKKIKEAYQIEHPYYNELSFLYGVIFTDNPQNKSCHSRNACIFADGELDRSPTGTGVSGRAALLKEKGELQSNRWITIESFIGTTMEVSFKEEVKYGSYQAIIPIVKGDAYITGIHDFWIDPNDPLRDGFFID